MTPLAQIKALIVGAERQVAEPTFYPVTCDICGGSGALPRAALGEGGK